MILMNNYEIVFESDNIIYIKMSELLIDEYLNMYNNEEIQRSLFKKLYSHEEILNWIKKQLGNKRSYLFSMIEKITGEYIGNVEIIPTNKDKVGEISISVIPSKQNKHFGSEAIKNTLKYAFEVLNFEGMELYVYTNNLKAIRCYENAGFKKNGEGITNEDIHMIIHK